MEGFCNIANDILLAKLKEGKSGIDVIPPKQVQGMVNQSEFMGEYLQFLNAYKYLGAHNDFLKKLGASLNCRYLLVPQLVVISNVNDNSLSVIWNFGKRSTDYSVIILAHVWDLSTGELIWTGRGTSFANVSLYDKSPSFDELATGAADELLKLMP